MMIRDRVRELRRVKACELLPNPKNWRTHPHAQAAALRDLLGEIGYADALLARETATGQLELIDGHLRAETTPNAEVPVLVLDLTEAEADKVLLSHDPLGAMAQADSKRVEQLLSSVRTDSEAVVALFERVAGEAAAQALNQRQSRESPEPEFDRADAFRMKWGTACGQLWQVAPTGWCAAIPQSEPWSRNCGPPMDLTCGWSGQIHRMASITLRRMGT
jgi:hypothetical protein